MGVAETIYLTLFVQTRGALNRELATHLRTRRMKRRSRAHTSRGHGRGQIVDAVAISERPAEVEDRAVPGHWEGDGGELFLAVGAGLGRAVRAAVAAPVEVTTRQCRARYGTCIFQCRAWMIDQVGSSRTVGSPAPNTS